MNPPGSTAPAQAPESPAPSAPASTKGSPLPQTNGKRNVEHLRASRRGAALTSVGVEPQPK